MTEETTMPGEAPQRSDPATDPSKGETAITDFGTPSEHASEVVAKPEVATFGDPDPPPSREGVKRVLAFLNEVAGGRKLLTACREDPVQRAVANHAADRVGRDGFGV